MKFTSAKQKPKQRKGGGSSKFNHKTNKNRSIQEEDELDPAEFDDDGDEGHDGSGSDLDLDPGTPGPIPPSYDDFLNSLNGEDDEDEPDEDKPSVVLKKKKKKNTAGQTERDASGGLKTPKAKKSKAKIQDKGQEYDNSDVDDEEMEFEEEPTVKNHKKALKKLMETDPDFYSYLEKNDADLLNFEDDEDESDSDEDEEAIHQPSATLEEQSDSEAEEEKVTQESVELQKVNKFLKKGTVNLHVIAYWEEKLANTRDLGVLVNVMEAFECAVETVVKQNEKSGAVKWKVEGQACFNSLVRLCIRHIKGFCTRFLCGSNNQALAESRFDQKPFEVMEKSKTKWIRLRPKLKNYMISLAGFIKSMGNSQAIAVVLRHCVRMSGFWALLASKTFKLLRTLINIWSTGEDSCRIVAFLSILRIGNYNRELFLPRLLKTMYLAYVSNCKFTSVNTWAGINFMRTSLVELYLLDPGLAYTIGFPYIRQLAIHLRNAITAGTGSSDKQTPQKRKEASRIVYSWQYVHSLNLWMELVVTALSGGDESLRLAVSPIVQICFGTIKLIPTRKYIPLRFHVIRMMIQLAEKGKVFIPILPLITAVLHLVDFGGKSVTKFSVRPLDLTCCLKADPTEGGYFKAVAEEIFSALIGTCQAQGAELAFPEIVCPTLIQLRTFIKKQCKNPEVSKKFKTLIDKIEANSEFIKTKRNHAKDNGLIRLPDLKSHQVLRAEILMAGPPIQTFAREYFTTSKRDLAKDKKLNIQTREESLIPRPSGAHSRSRDLSSSQGSEDEDDGGPLFSGRRSDSGEDEKEFRTKLDSSADLEESHKNESTKKQSKGSKRKKASTNDESRKKKIKKMKKSLSAARNNEDNSLDVQDELVDFEFSD